MFAHHEVTISAWPALAVLGGYTLCVLSAVVKKRINKKGK